MTDRERADTANGTGEAEGPSLAEIFRDELIAKSSARGQKSIARIWEACEELLRDGRRITVAEVGRITEKRWGGPKEQSIRDQPDRLKRLVEMCAEAQGAERIPDESPSRAGVRIDKLVSQISDQLLRARVRAIAEERDRLRRDVAMLRKGFQRLAPISGLTMEQCYGELPQKAAEIDAGTAPAIDEQFSAEEIAAVAKFLDPDFLFDENMEIDDRRGLVSAQGRNILPRAFITALRKVVEGKR